MATVSYLVTFNKGAFADVKCPKAIIDHALKLDTDGIRNDVETLDSLTIDQKRQALTFCAIVDGLKGQLATMDKVEDTHFSLTYRITNGGVHALRLKAVGSGYTVYKAVNTTASMDLRKVCPAMHKMIEKKLEKKSEKPTTTRTSAKQRAAELEVERDDLKKQLDAANAILAKLGLKQIAA